MLQTTKHCISPLPQANCLPQRARVRHIWCPATPSDVFVLDFDGVLADSQHEVSSAGINAATAQWPPVFERLESQEIQRVLAGLERCRPRLVRGFETMIMARLIAESDENVCKILDPTWAEPGGLLESTLASWGADEATLAAEFEGLRARRMELDDDDFASLAPLYDGIKDALTACQSPFYIASSKREDRLVRFLNVLLEMGLEGPSPRVLGDLIPPNEKKIEALRAIMSRPIASDVSSSLHFVDDRFETLEAIAQEGDLRRFNLYLAAWGYNTPEERQAAAKLPGVRVISLQQFCELLKFGIIMGVNDGCQDTEEEALAAVYNPVAPQKIVGQGTLLNH